MFVWGTANPVGEDNQYDGFFFTQRDIDTCLATDDMIGKPVKIEHKGVDVGKVVSAWKNSQGQIDCILDVNEDIFEGAVVSRFVNSGVCRELSLGYVVDMKQSKAGQKATPVQKKIVEVSIVKKGARDKCFIHSCT